MIPCCESNSCRVMAEPQRRQLWKQISDDHAMSAASFFGPTVHRGAQRGNLDSVLRLHQIYMCREIRLTRHLWSNFGNAIISMRSSFNLLSIETVLSIILVHQLHFCAPNDLPESSPYSNEAKVHHAYKRYIELWRAPLQAEIEHFFDAAKNACQTKPSRIIAMSLYGPEGSNFFHGAMKNTAARARIYPEWTLRIYSSVGPAAAAALRSNGAEVIEMPEPQGIYGMFWRFFSASDPCAEYIIFRDTDSILNPRERAAVDDWIARGGNAHSMIDSPEHSNWAVQGGMWGVRGGVIIDMQKRAAAWGLWEKKLDDMHFLQRVIWPELRSSAVVHSSVASIWGGIPFPKHKGWRGHVGQQVFKAPYTPSCPVRSGDPDESMLLNATAYLQHNGLVYQYRASKEPSASIQHTQNAALALTHLAAAQGCARWAAEKYVLSRQAWEALREVLRVNAVNGSADDLCSSSEAGQVGVSDGAAPQASAISCIDRINKLISRLLNPSILSEPPRRRGSSQAAAANATNKAQESVATTHYDEDKPGEWEEASMAEWLEAAQKVGSRRGKWLVCHPQGGIGAQIEAAVTCLLLSLASRRALLLTRAVPPLDTHQSWELLGPAFARLYSPKTLPSKVAQDMCQGNEEECQDSGKGAGDKEARMRLGCGEGAEDRASAEALMCANVTAAWEPLRVVEVHVQGWQPLSAYNSLLAPHLPPPPFLASLPASPSLTNMQGLDLGSQWVVGVLGGMAMPSDDMMQLLLPLWRILRQISPPDAHYGGRDKAAERLEPDGVTVVSLHVRLGRDKSVESGREVHGLLPHPVAISGFPRCAYASSPSTPRRNWLLVADSDWAAAEVSRLVVQEEGGAARSVTSLLPPAAGQALERAGARLLLCRSGSLVALLPPARRMPGEDEEAFRSREERWARVSMWALGVGDVMISSYASSLSTLPRALAAYCSLFLSPPPAICAAARPTGGEMREMTVTREGSCVKRPPAAGAAMRRCGVALRGLSCWDERAHGRLAWFPPAAMRPDRPRPATAPPL